MASNKEPRYILTPNVCVYSKTTQLNLTKISEIVFSDVSKVLRASSLNHIKNIPSANPIHDLRLPI